MRDHINPRLNKHAKTMRHAMTTAEKRLWWHLRHRVILQDSHFRRQVVIGNSIADFASVTYKLVIEIDGAQHGFDKNLMRDDTRDTRIRAGGWRILRFWNHQVMQDMDSVIETIAAEIAGDFEGQPTRN